jgi:hypothetical protein
MEERRPTVSDYIAQLAALLIRQEELWEQYVSGDLLWMQYVDESNDCRKKALEAIDQLDKYVRLQKIDR